MKSNIFLSLIFFIALGFSACSDDGDDGNVDCNSSFSIQSEVQAEVEAFTDAAILYGNNPSPENCENYRAAATAYFNAVASLEDCAEELGLGAEFSQALQAAQASVDGIEC